MKLIQIRCENEEGCETRYYNYELVISNIRKDGYMPGYNYIIDFPPEACLRNFTDHYNRSGFTVLKSECNIIKTLK